MLNKFFHEEIGQGVIEYIMLVGGIAVAAIMVSAIYKRAAVTVGNSFSSTVNVTVKAESKSISESLVGF